MPRIAHWVTLVAALTLIPVFAAQTVTPTVVFNRWGPCGSRPDVRELTVAEGTPIRLINQTGVDATVAVDSEDVTNVPDGSETLLTLPPGQHAVTMVPDCQRSRNIAESTVTVTAGAAANDPAPASAPSAEGAPPDASHPGVEMTESSTGPEAATPNIAAAQADTGGGRLPRLLAVVASILFVCVVAATARVVVRAGRRADHEPHRTAQVALAVPTQGTGDEATNYVRKRLQELVQAAHRGADPRQVEAEREELFAQYSPPDRDSDTERNLDDEDRMRSPEPPGTGAAEGVEPNTPRSPVS